MHGHCGEAWGFGQWFGFDFTEHPGYWALAQSKNFTLPDSLPYYLNARYAALIRNQDSNMGPQYLADQISSHEDALAVFQDAVATGTDPDVKAALTQVIPTVQSNLEALQNLAGQK
jgi:predicted outer membrane protein